MYMSTSTKMYSSVNANEKLSFAMTCNRLSLFLKEKRSLKDLGINANLDAKEKLETVDLLSNMESPVQTFSTKSEKTITQNVNLEMDLLCKRGDLTNISDYNETGSKTRPMTIFYGGQVLVFDNISDDKVRDVMLLASGASSKIQSRSDSNSSNTTCNNIFGSLELTIISRLKGPNLPMARRASLHKFLERRKNRVTLRPTPYQSKNMLKATTHNFDLNF